MTRMNPFRRLAATAAIVGVTAFGAVALASPAMADPGGSTAAAAKADKPVGTVELPNLDTMTIGDLMGALHDASAMAIQSPLPTGSVIIDIAHFKLTYTPQAAQVAQTVIANFYDALGYQVAFSDVTGVLVFGDKICDPTKSAKANKGCVDPAAAGGRF